MFSHHQLVTTQWLLSTLITTTSVAQCLTLRQLSTMFPCRASTTITMTPPILTVSYVHQSWMYVVLKQGCRPHELSSYSRTDQGQNLLALILVLVSVSSGLGLGLKYCGTSTCKFCDNGSVLSELIQWYSLLLFASTICLLDLSLLVLIYLPTFNFISGLISVLDSAWSQGYLALKWSGLYLGLEVALSLTFASNVLSSNMCLSWRIRYFMVRHHHHLPSLLLKVGDC